MKSVRCKSQDITMRWSQVRASEFRKHVLYIDKINKTWFASEKVYWHQPSAPKFSKTLVLKVFCRWREGGSRAAPTWVARLFPTLQGFQKNPKVQHHIYIAVYILYIYAYVHAKLCIHIMYVYVNIYICIYICQKQHVLNSFFFMSCTYANSADNI